ncbi:hypothetical protein UY3_03359 [Chelonia mydas]|uniref:Uncharacterized protein n=1 Tax=Chelonia mydas TaxID=8469 RepID=M7C4N7_CHEMY|nr:hypothetical protein UY3_03359 [Chelonia mydas]
MVGVKHRERSIACHSSTMLRGTPGWSCPGRYLAAEGDQGSKGGLLMQCSFRPGPYAACLCAAMVPLPLMAQWYRQVSLTETRTTVALPKNLRKRIAQILAQTFEEITEADYCDVREHVNTLFRI